MKGHISLYTGAARYDLIEHARNRFVMLLVVLYVPTWVTLAYLVIPDKAVPVHLRATGQDLVVPGNELTQSTGAINAVTLITGFMVFAATFNGSRFDRRLGMASTTRAFTSSWPRPSHSHLPTSQSSSPGSPRPPPETPEHTVSRRGPPTGRCAS